MKMSLVGQKIVGCDFAQRKTFFEFPDVQFGPGSFPVKMPDGLCGQWQIADKRMIKIRLVLPQGYLILFFLRRLRTANNKKLMRSLPIVRLISKLSRLPSAFAERAIPQCLNLGLNRPAHFGYNRVADTFVVERFDKLVFVESGIRTHSNPIKIFRNFPAANFPKVFESRYRMRVSRPQYSMPCVPRMSFEAKQRMITRSSPIPGIVSNVRSLDIATKQWQNCGIQIQNQTVGRSNIPNSSAQQIVNARNPLNFRDGQTLDKLPYSRSIGKISQTQNTLNISVVGQNTGIRKSTHSRDNCANNRHNQICGWINRIAAFPENVALKNSFQIDFSTKLLKKHHPAEMGEMRILEGECDFSDTFWHTAQSSLKVRFLQKTF